MTHPLQPTMDALVHYKENHEDDLDYPSRYELKATQALTDLKALMDSHVLVEKKSIEKDQIKKAIYKAWMTNSPTNFGEAMVFAADEVLTLITASNGGE